MSALELITKAIEFDATGHRLQALKLYRAGIVELEIMCRNESDPGKKLKLQEKIDDYEKRVDFISNSIELSESKGEIKDQIHILDGSKRHSYETIFGKYLDSTVNEVTIEEPYLKMNYQLHNLVTFCELLVLKCINLKFIRVITTRAPQNDQQQSTNNDLRQLNPNLALNDQQRENAFQTLRNSLQDLGIEINFDIDDKLHHRQVVLSNGYVIKICRGLHFLKAPTNYHSIGAFNQNFRECRQTNIDIMYCPAIKK